MSLMLIILHGLSRKALVVASLLLWCSHATCGLTVELGQVGGSPMAKANAGRYWTQRASSSAGTKGKRGVKR